MKQVEYDNKKLIENELTANGGYTKETLAKWGISWPPPKGWKKKLIKGRTLNGQEIKTVKDKDN